MSSLQIFVNFPEHSGVFQKKVFKNIFLASSNKKALQNNFSGDLQMKEKKNGLHKASGIFQLKNQRFKK